MAIEWDKILTKPDKSYKVEGHTLLQFRHKSELNEKKIAELTGRSNDLTEKIATLTAQITNLETKLSQKDETISNFETKLETSNSSISERDEKAKKLEDTIKEKDDIISRLKAELSRLDAELSAAVQEATKSENETNNLRKEVETLQQTLTKAQARIEDSNSKATQLFLEIDEKDSIIANLSQEIENLKEQIPKKPVYEEAEETVKGAGCPKCGWTTLEEYKIVDGKKQLIRKYCPNTFCLWTSVEEPKITISLTAEGPEEIDQSLRLFKITGTELEATQSLDSSKVIIIADPAQNTVWIWKGKESSRFEYAEATRHAATVKNDVVQKASANIIRVNEGEEPENFPV